MTKAVSGEGQLLQVALAVQQTTADYSTRMCLGRDTIRETGEEGKNREEEEMEGFWKGAREKSICDRNFPTETWPVIRCAGASQQRMLCPNNGSM